MFGKISAILVTLTAVITIVSYFFPQAEDLEVRGSFHTFALPPNLSKMLKDLKVGQSYQAIRDHLIEDHSKIKFNLKKEEIIALSELIEDSFKSIWVDDFKYQVQKYRGLIVLDIKNTGSKTAGKIILDLPVSGIALITRQDDSQKTIKFNKKIELEDIRPKNRTQIAIWSENKAGIYDEDEFYLTHANGVGEFSFGKTVYGFSRFFDEKSVLFFLIFGIFFIFGIISLLPSPSTNNVSSKGASGKDEGDEKKTDKIVEQDK